jgi:hypothetical protein
MNPMRPHAAILAIGVTLAACGDSSGTGRVNMQLATRPQLPVAAAAARASFSAGGGGQTLIELGGDQLLLTQVELVLRKVKLEGATAGACGGSASMSLDVEAEAEECGEFRAGPTLLDLPLGEGVVQTFSVTVPVGSYHGIQFQIHRPTNANEDADFLAQHPEFADVSIRVTGTFQQAGDPAPVPFTYTTGLTSVVNVELDSPVAVTEGAALDVTLDIDLSGWFADQEAGRLIDPATALDPHNPLAAMVAQNIRQSFHAFEDEDRNGAED